MTGDFHKPKPYTDAGLRRHHYGPIQPLDTARGCFNGVGATLLVLMALGGALWLL